MDIDTKTNVMAHHYSKTTVKLPFRRKIDKTFAWSEGHLEPSTTDLEQWKLEMESDIASKKYIELRKTAYENAGLTFEYWNEIKIELDTAIFSGDQTLIDKAQAIYNKAISDRNQIRLEIPKPN